MPEPTPPPRNPGPARAGRPPGLAELRAFADAVLVEMVGNRDVRWDDAGRPVATLRQCGAEGEGTWLCYEVDMSGIGMPMDTPLIVQAVSGDDALTWTLGETPLARTPRDATPKETADRLGMDTLLDAFRRFVADSGLFLGSPANDAGKGRGPVAIDRADCTCSACGGSLTVTDVEEATMGVTCENGHTAELAHDAFEAGFDYVLKFLSRRGG